MASYARCRVTVDSGPTRLGCDTVTAHGCQCLGISLDCPLPACHGAGGFMSPGEMGWATGSPACFAPISLWVAAEAQAWLSVDSYSFCS